VADGGDGVMEWWSGGDMTYFRIAFALRVGVPDGLRLSMPIVTHAYSRTRSLRAAD
jgi:hypothetical protein